MSTAWTSNRSTSTERRRIGRFSRSTSIAERFLDFVSTRSPVFKERPLPRSKREAIDLMMENPNLIRRPILVRDRR